MSEPTAPAPEPKAYEHYRVERVHSTDLDTPPAKRKGLRRPKPTPGVYDQIRILDREGAVVWEQAVEPRAAEAQERQIVEDLLAMSLIAFRAKWRLDAG